MANINLVSITGNLTADPELRQTANGTPVCSLRVAVNKRVKRGEQWEDKGIFIPVEVFGNQATSCAQYLRKGAPVAIAGSFDFDQWTDQQTQQKRSKLYVVADTVQFLSTRNGNTNGNGHNGHDGAPAPQQYQQPQPVQQPVAQQYSTAPAAPQPLVYGQMPAGAPQPQMIPTGAPAPNPVAAIGGVPATSDDIPF